jgi:hypothetical protein
MALELFLALDQTTRSLVTMVSKLSLALDQTTRSLVSMVS